MEVKYPASHKNTKRAGAKIVAFEGDQAFMDSLLTHPRDYPFSVQFGGNLYIRGGDRIDPEDPAAIKSSRPRLKRDAVRQFVKGSQNEILNSGLTAEEEAARTAFEKKKKYGLIMERKSRIMKIKNINYKKLLNNKKNNKNNNNYSYKSIRIIKIVKITEIMIIKTINHNDI